MSNASASLQVAPEATQPGAVATARTSWLWTAVALTVVCLAIAHLVFWQHGLYLDDYALRTRVIDPITGATTPIWSRYMETYPARVLMHLVAFELLAGEPQAQLFERTLLAACVAFNACLLGGIVYRAVASRTAALVAASIFMVPVFATEAVFWTTAAAEYVFAGTCALLFVHCIIDGACGKAGLARTAVLAAVTMGIALMFAEAFIAVVMLAPLVAMVAALRQGQPRRATGSRTAVAMSLALPLALGFALVLAYSPLPSLLGGLDLSSAGLLSQGRAFAARTYWLTVSSDFGWPVLRQVSVDGLASLVATPGLRALLAAAAILGVCLVATWSSRPADRSASYSHAAALFGIGLLWTVVPIPAVVARGQSVDPRLLYLPTAGAGITAGALVWFVEKWTGGRGILARLPIAVAVTTLILGSIAMAGHARLYAIRSQQDAAQIEAATRALPPSLLPREAVIVPYQFDSGQAGDPSSRVLFGVFEAWWSASEALNAALRRADLMAITGNRWSRWTFALDGDRSTQRMRIQGTPVALDKLVVLAVQDQRIAPVESLVIHACDGTATRVALPTAQAWLAAGLGVVHSIDVPGSVPCASREGES
jgi:hypothetical protein